ncbi:MAG: LPS export ABC transporter periplasmic protein LptC [Nitrospirae bacterium]|nr:LPS export ABC transporter periplasmic protein LptC [Nitrospirota bacterium]
MSRMVIKVLAILFLIALAAYLKYGRDGSVLTLKGSESSMDDVRIIQKRDGSEKWTLEAKKAVFIDNKEVKLYDIEVRLHKEGLLLRSNSGTYDIESKNLKIEGEVKASTKEYNIAASGLYWDSNKGELLSSDMVKVRGEEFYVEGRSLTATSGDARLNKDVRAVFNEK